MDVTTPKEKLVFPETKTDLRESLPGKFLSKSKPELFVDKANPNESIYHQIDLDFLTERKTIKI